MSENIEQAVTDPLSILRDIERRAHARQCTLDALRRLEQELKHCVNGWRQARETQREKGFIEAESPELRMALHAALLGIRRGLAEHGAAEDQVKRIADLVRRGHLQRATIERTKIMSTTRFSDLNLDFVGEAVSRRETRGQRLVIAGVVVAAIVLLAAAIIELVKRSS